MPKQQKGRLPLLFYIQRGICASCGKPMLMHGGTAQHANIDEVIPQSKGGYRMLGNQVAMHSKCNTKKADRYPTGCEIIMLHAVNARLASVFGLDFSKQRHLVRRRRKKRK